MSVNVSNMRTGVGAAAYSACRGIRGIFRVTACRRAKAWDRRRHQVPVLVDATRSSRPASY